MTAPYSFRPMTAQDIVLVQAWLRTPDVARWWEDDEDPELYFAEALSDPNMALWIVSHHGRPFAYVQDYNPHAWEGHHFHHLPAGSRGVDQFIGEPDMLGRGHGSAFVRAHVDRLLEQGAPAVGVDPHPGNPRAVRAYEKAGFTRGQAQDTEWGYCLLMTRYKE